jgi:hypothetical protein
MRAATTSLHRMLDLHPEIAMSREKESDFFVAELNYRRGVEWYRGLFPAVGGLHGESSTNYTKSSIFAGVPARIKSHYPGVRFIYIVRDPIARALSQLRFCASLGQDPTDPILVRQAVDASCYARQMDGFLAHFERERILVVDYAALTSDASREIARIGDFLGVRAPWPTISGLEGNNSGAELVRIPKWFFRLRRIPLVSDMRRRLPKPLADGMRRLVASGPPREMTAISAKLLDPFLTELSDDAQRLRRMLTSDFSDWPI